MGCLIVYLCCLIVYLCSNCTMCHPWWNPTEMSNQTVICFLNCQEIFSRFRPKIPIPNGDGITNTEKDARNANSTLNQYFLGSHFNYLLEMKIWLFTYSRLWSSPWTGMLKTKCLGKSSPFRLLHKLQSKFQLRKIILISQYYTDMECSRVLIGLTASLDTAKKSSPYVSRINS